MAAAQQAQAKVVTVVWDRNAESTVIGYRVSYGTQSGIYSTTVDVGNVTSYQVNLPDGFKYFVVVRALDSFGQVSPPSNEASVDLTIVTPPAAPIVTSLSPLSGPIGTSVTIAGSGFGSSQGTSTVRFNGTTATPISWSATSIVVPVPSGASTGPVVVTVGGVASNILSFTVSASAPTITSLLPTSGPTGTSVTIAGVNFGATQGASVVRFNGAVATPTIWSAAAITVPVPSGATTGPVTVTVSGVVSNGVTFNVTTGTAPPVTLTQQRTLETGGTGATLAFPANNTAGNFIAVAVRAFYINQAITVSDSRGNVYRQALKFNNVDPGGVDYDDTVALFYAENIGGGANTVTVSLSRAASLRFAILEYAGVATSNALDVSRSAAASGSSPNSGSATTTAPGDLVLGIFSTQSYRTFTAGSGFTTRASVNTAPNTVLMVADRVLTTPGSIAATATLSGSDIWGAGLAAFRSASGGTTNRPPVLTQPSNQTHAENSSPTLALSASDPDGTALTYSATGLPPALAINSTTGVISGTLTFTSAGSYTVAATASDGQLSSTKSFTWTVADTNRPPTLTQPVNQTNTENTAVSLQLAASDPDGTAVTYSASGLPPSLSVNAATGLISGTLTFASAGTHTVTATVTDGASSNSKTFTWTVTDVAQAPVLTNLSPTSGPSGTAVTIAGANFGATQGASVVRFNGTVATPTSWSATAIGVPVPSGATTGPVTVTVGGVVSNGVTFNVTTSSAPPVTLTQQRTIETGGTSATLAFPANNTAGNFIAVAVRAFYINQAITVSDSRGNVYRQALKFNNVDSGGVDYDDTVALFYAENIGGGANTVTVSLSRAASLRFAILEYAGVATSNALDVTSSAASRSTSPNSGSATTTAPGDLVLGVFSTQSYRTFTAGSSFTTRASVNTAPNTVLMVADRVLTTPGSVVATATLSATDIWGAGLVAFRSAASGSSTQTTQTLTTNLASDGGAPDSQTASDAPVLASIANQTNLKTASVSLSMTASDPGGDPLTYRASGLPTGLSVDTETGLISGSLSASSAGTYVVTATATDGRRSASRTFEWTVVNPSPFGDYDGDGLGDVALYHPANGQWEILPSTSSFASSIGTQFGTETDVPVPGDYDGDGRTNVAYYRPSTGSWSILPADAQSANALEVTTGPGNRVPVPADYDGDGATDAGVYEGKTGLWRVLLSGTSFGGAWTANLGGQSDVPMAGDYDGDGQADPAVYRPATGAVTILLSTTGYATTVAVNSGVSNAKPAPADFDGDGRTDVVLFRAAAGSWHVLMSGKNFTSPVVIAAASDADVPLPADHDGDGKADLVVVQSGTWRILRSGSNYRDSLVLPGAPERKDISLPTHP